MNFPEVPLLVFPSLARRIGVEESVLYYICQQLLTGSEATNKLQISVTNQHWQQVTNLWNEQELSVLVASLSAKGVLQISQTENKIIITMSDQNTSHIDVPSNSTLHNTDVLAKRNESEPVTQSGSGVNVSYARATQTPAKTADFQSDTTQVLPVYDVPPAPPTRPLPVRQSPVQQAITANNKPNTGELIKGIGPAPSFGGYKRQRNAHDPFKQLLDDKEQQNKKLYAMTMDWKPSELLLSTLTRNNIPHDVANSTLDEFRLYYCDKNKKERSWDQKFLAWVKNAWVKKQSAQARGLNTSNQVGTTHENSQRDTREKRKRISAAIMDIHDTNW